MRLEHRRDQLVYSITALSDFPIRGYGLEIYATLRALSLTLSNQYNA